MNFVPNTDSDRRIMMDFLNISSINDLFMDVNENIRMKEPMNLPKPLSEIEVSHHMEEIARSCVKIADRFSFLGAGAYKHFIPSVVTHLAQRGEFLTSYTPYQAEMSQGMLQSIFEFQSMMCELTKMDVANASMYDGATAMAEAAIMASKITDRQSIVISKTVHPEYRQVLATYANAFGLDVVEVEYKDGLTDLGDLEAIIDEKVACSIVQSPNFFGCIEDQYEAGKIAHSKESLSVSCVVEPISLGILKPPGELGTDIVVGEGQALGNPVSYGGPNLGFMTTKREFLKKIPGRIAGLTVDKKGQSGFILTLQTREQHVRRERATSNICTNQAVNALAATIYLALLGKSGFSEVAKICAHRAHYAQKRISEIKGFESAHSAPFFNEFCMDCPTSPQKINSALLKKKILGGFGLGRFYKDLDNCMMFAVTEMNSKEEIDRLVDVLSEVVL
jgi:glycine dehydrogenase subunit 1